MNSGNNIEGLLNEVPIRKITIIAKMIAIGISKKLNIL